MKSRGSDGWACPLLGFRLPLLLGDKDFHPKMRTMQEDTVKVMLFLKPQPGNNFWGTRETTVKNFTPAKTATSKTKMASKSLLSSMSHGHAFHWKNSKSSQSSNPSIQERAKRGLGLVQGKVGGT